MSASPVDIDESEVSFNAVSWLVREARSSSRELRQAPAETAAELILEEFIRFGLGALECVATPAVGARDNIFRLRLSRAFQRHLARAARKHALDLGHDQSSKSFVEESDDSTGSGN